MSLSSAGKGSEVGSDYILKKKTSRHSVSKEFSLGLLEYENTRPMYDINKVTFYSTTFLRFNISFPKLDDGLNNIVHSM